MFIGGVFDYWYRNDASKSVNRSILNLQIHLTATFYSDLSVDISSNLRDRKTKVRLIFMFK